MPQKIVKPICKRAKHPAIHPSSARAQALSNSITRHKKGTAVGMNQQQGSPNSSIHVSEFPITKLYFVKVRELAFNTCIGCLLTPMCRFSTLKPSCQIQPGFLSLTWLCEEAEQRCLSLPLSPPAIPSLFHSLFLSFTPSVSILLPYSLSLWKSMQNAL